MNGGVVKLSAEGGRTLKRWWSTDRRIRSANAHKIPQSDPSLSPSTPHYLSQTCSALVKRKTFKRREPPPAVAALAERVTPAKSRIPLRPSESLVVVEVTDTVMDEPELPPPPPATVADPLYTPGVEIRREGDATVCTPRRRARGSTFRAFSLLKSVPEDDEGLSHAMDAASYSSSSMDSANSQCTRVSDASSTQSRQATKSEAIIGGFKEYLGEIKRNRPRYVDDIAFSLEDLWCTGKLEDLADLENMWMLAISPVTVHEN